MRIVTNKDTSFYWVSVERTLGDGSKSAILIGTFERDVDGYYYFWEKEDMQGAWSAWLLGALAAALEEVNQPWDREVEELEGFTAQTTRRTRMWLRRMWQIFRSHA